MSRPAAKYTIVRTLSGFHVRLVSGNGAKVQWSENYPRVARARRAVELACLAAGRAASAAKKIAAHAELVDERPSVHVPGSFASSVITPGDQATQLS